jgi:hypothetical protein
VPCNVYFTRSTLLGYHLLMGPAHQPSPLAMGKVFGSCAAWDLCGFMSLILVSVRQSVVWMGLKRPHPNTPDGVGGFCALVGNAVMASGSHLESCPALCSWSCASRVLCRPSVLGPCPPAPCSPFSCRSP